MSKTILRLFDRIEFPVLLAGAVVAGGLWGFLELTEVARDTVPHSLDTQILLAFREAGQPDNPIGSPRVEGMVRDFTALGSSAVLTLIAAAVAVYLFLVRRAATALYVLAVIGGGQVLGSLLKLGVDRPRPELVSHLAAETSLSFPSGHAMLSAVTYLTLALLAGRFVRSRAVRLYLLALGILVTFLVGASRLYLGVHWPSDVLAGWCAGFAWAMLCWLAARFTARRGPDDGSN